MAAILQLTDGSITIDFLNQTTYPLIAWSPVPRSYKGGGIFQESESSPGRRPVFRQDTNPIETINFGIVGSSENDVISKLQVLQDLLQRAFDYWVPGSEQNTIIYLVTKTTNETNTRYAPVIKGDIDGLSDVYFGSFQSGIISDGMTQVSGFSDLNLILERDQWQGNVPGTGTAIALSAAETFNGILLGNVNSAGTQTPVTTNDVFLASRRVPSNLSHIYVFDNSAGTFGSNLMTAALPFNLFPGSPALSDIIYFGVQTSISGSTPFSSLIFDIGQAAAGTHEVQWEYSVTGPSWSLLTTTDETDTTGDNQNKFKATGVKSVSWRVPGNWITTAINGITAWWVRARISAFTSMSTVPQQANRDIYTVSWPYTQIESSQVVSSQPALGRIRLYQRGSISATGKAILGMRSTSRGTSFVANVNISDTAAHNPTGITVTTITGDVTFVDNVLSPSGRAARYDPPSLTTLGGRVLISFSSTISSQFQGKFRAFAAIYRSGTTTTFTSRLLLREGSGTTTTFASKISTLPTSGFAPADTRDVFDYGIISIPSGKNLPYTNMGDISIQVDISSGDGTDNIDVLQLILIPADEYIIDISSSHLSDGKYADIDSISQPKSAIQAGIFNTITGKVESTRVIPITPFPYVLIKPASQMRVYFLGLVESSEAFYIADPLVSLQLTYTPRYDTLRGTA